MGMDFWKVLEYSLSVTVVGVLIWLVKLIFHDKLDARWHYFIWLVLLVRLVIPVDFSLIRTPVSVFQGIPVGRWIEYGRLMADRKGWSEVFVVLGRVYLWGAVLLGGYYLTIWAILRLRLLFAAKADEGTRQYVEEIAAKYGLKGCHDIRISRSSTPYICGLIHPVLVLPEDNARPEGHAQSEGNTRPEEPVIVHELLHRKWKDVAVNVLLHMIRVVNWFNPVIWFLTGVVQNDGEALCDQRVLECYSEEMEKDYGEMLLAMTRGRRRNPVKAGTSNMAGSYRNMRTRIRRISDFHRVPTGIGFVVSCITLILAAAGVSASTEAQGYAIHAIETEGELQKELLKAQLYHARTPEEAVWLFLRAAAERNVLYRASVLPGERVGEFEEFAYRCWRQGSLTERGSLIPTENPCLEETGAYFPRETFEGKQQYLIYNLQCDEERGTATVFVRPGNGEEGSAYTEWRLALVKEDGWKVWLAGDPGRMTGVYQEPSLLYGSTRAGDFRLEISAYNEAYFDSLGCPQPYAGLQDLTDRQGATETDIFPKDFSMEYKVVNYYIAYVGQESLEGHSVRAEVTEDGREASAEEMYGAYHAFWNGDTDVPPSAQGASGDRYADVPDAAGGVSGDGDIDRPGVSYSASGDGYAMACFDGRELANGGPRLIGGGGNGSFEAGQGWKADDRICAHVRIYVDGTLVEESDIWSGEH